MSKTMENMTLVPGSRIRLISKANIRYEGTLVSVDDDEGKLSLSHVFSFGGAEKTSQPPSASQHSVYGYVVFRRSELEDIEVLDTPKPWPTDPAVVHKVENLAERRAVKFSNQVLTWIEKGENEKITLILENAHLHDSFDSEKRTLLHYAVQHDNVTVAEKLLEMGSEVDVEDAAGMTPLMMAMEVCKKRGGGYARYSTMMGILLAAGADIMYLNKNGRSAVHMFCSDYEAFHDIGEEFFEKLRHRCPLSEDLVDLLIDAGCTLHQVCEFLRDVKTMELMIQRGLPVDVLDEVRAEPLLHLAINLRDVGCVELLMKHGANVQLENDVGDTPWECLRNDHNDFEIAPDKEARIVQLLLSHGASPTTCVYGGLIQGQNTLEFAERDTIRLILEYNLDFSATDESKQSALHFLAMNNNPGVVEELKPFKKNNVNVNIRDEKGATPLYWVAKYGNTEMLEFLLSIGAEVDCRTVKGFTPLYYLCAKSFTNPKRNDLCAEILLQHRADPQLVIVGTNGERITVFEAATTGNKFSSTKPFVAQMAISEVLGTPITDSVRAKIRSDPALEEHLKHCRQLLRREIAGTATLLTLLTADKTKMAKLLHNQDLVLKLKDSFFSELRLSSPYYHNIIKKRYADGVRYRKLRDRSALSVAKLFGEGVDEGSLIVDRILDFLDDVSLGCLKDLL